MERATIRYLLVGILLLTVSKQFASPPDLTGEWSLISRYFFVDATLKIDRAQFHQDAVLVFISESSVEISYSKYIPGTGFIIDRKKKYTCEYVVFQKHNEDRIRIDEQEYLFIQMNANKYLLIPIQGEDAPLYALGTPQYLVSGPEIPKEFGVY